MKWTHKLSALIRVTPFMTDFNEKVMLNSLLNSSSFIVPHSGFCMFSTRAKKHKIKRLHDKGLITLQNDVKLVFIYLYLYTSIHVKKNSKIDDRILQISLRSFHFQCFQKEYLSMIFEVVK